MAWGAFKRFVVSSDRSTVLRQVVQAMDNKSYTYIVLEDDVGALHEIWFKPNAVDNDCVSRVYFGYTKKGEVANLHFFHHEQPFMMIMSSQKGNTS